MSVSDDGPWLRRPHKQNSRNNSPTSKHLHRDALLATNFPPSSHPLKASAPTIRSRRNPPQPTWPTDSLPSRSSTPAVSPSQLSTSLAWANFEPKSRQTSRAHPKPSPPTPSNSSRSPSSARTPSSSRPLRTTMATTTISWVVVEVRQEAALRPSSQISQVPTRYEFSSARRGAESNTDVPRALRQAAPSPDPRSATTRAMRHMRRRRKSPR